MPVTQRLEGKCYTLQIDTDFAGNRIPVVGCLRLKDDPELVRHYLLAVKLLRGQGWLNVGDVGGSMASSSNPDDLIEDLEMLFWMYEDPGLYKVKHTA